MRILRSRHVPMVLSLGLFGLLIWWTNTPKRPVQDDWQASGTDAQGAWELHVLAEFDLGRFAYDHVTVMDTFNHHLGLLAQQLPSVGQKSHLDACCPSADDAADGGQHYRAALRFSFHSREGRMAFLEALQGQGFAAIRPAATLPAGFGGRADIDLAIPGRATRLNVEGMQFKVWHANAHILS